MAESNLPSFEDSTTIKEVKVFTSGNEHIDNIFANLPDDERKASATSDLKAIANELFTRGHYVSSEQALLNDLAELIKRKYYYAF